MKSDAQLVSFVERALGVWRALVERVPLLKATTTMPTTVGVKVADQSALFDSLTQYFELGDQVHLGPVNGVRSIASIAKQEPLVGEIRFIKLLQRRPGRTDPLGPEHIDLLVPSEVSLHSLRDAISEANLVCELEKNDFHGWLSVRADGIEFKLVHEVVWESCIKEMQNLLKLGSPPLKLEIGAKS